MLKSLGQILLCYVRANWEVFIEVNGAVLNLRKEKKNIYILWKILFHALSLGSICCCFKYLLLYKYGYFLKQIIDLVFSVIYTSHATVISNIYKAKGLDLK